MVTDGNSTYRSEHFLMFIKDKSYGARLKLISYCVSTLFQLKTYVCTISNWEVTICNGEIPGGPHDPTCRS